MVIVRLGKAVMVAAVALYASLVALGNITDYGTNFAFVQHVLTMDTVFAEATTVSRAIAAPALHHLFYGLIIAGEALTALLCWAGAYALLTRLRAPAARFNRAKGWAMAGLLLGFLVWQVGFMTIGGEWFGMWMSQSWNGLQSAFRVFITILGVMIFLNQPDGELQEA